MTENYQVEDNVNKEPSFLFKLLHYSLPPCLLCLSVLATIFSFLLKEGSGAKIHNNITFTFNDTALTAGTEIDKLYSQMDTKSMVISMLDLNDSDVQINILKALSIIHVLFAVCSFVYSKLINGNLDSLKKLNTELFSSNMNLNERLSHQSRPMSIQYEYINGMVQRKDLNLQSTPMSITTPSEMREVIDDDVNSNAPSVKSNGTDYPRPLQYTYTQKHEPYV